MIDRPLSPHIQIYKPQITSVLSILHRLAGVALATGLVALCFFLMALANDRDCFYSFSMFLKTFIGKILVWGWLTSLYYHFANGIRHLFWDIGCGFDLQTVTRSGWLVVFLTTFLSVMTIGILL